MKLKLLLVYFMLVLATSMVFAQKTYSGATQDYWDIAGNWTPSGVPAASDNVIIPAAKFVYIRTTVSRTGTTSIAAASAGIQVIGNGTLNNTGAITANGSLDITATPSGTATLNNNSGGTITINGGVTTYDGGGSALYADGTGTAVFNNNSGATITLNNYAYIQESATSTMTITNAGTININSNSLMLINAPGTFSNTGTINSSGTITGNGGVISGSLFTNPSGSTINGVINYSCLTFSNGLTNNGTIEFNVNGTTDCTEKDKVTVTGVMTFGGTFTAKGSPPADGPVTLMTYTSRSGATKFTNTSAQFDNGKYLNIVASDYGATSLTGTISSTLPVELITFTANTEGSKTTLTWTTASETNNKGFDIERSRDGETFQSIGNVKGVGKAANYNFVDTNPFGGVNYYRLKQVDFDGTETLSKVVSVTTTGKGTGKIKIYPTHTEGVLTVDSEQGTGNNVAVYNAMGQLVLSNTGVNRLDLSAMPSGLYFVQVKAGGETVTEKVFKK